MQWEGALIWTFSEYLRILQFIPIAWWMEAAQSRVNPSRQSDAIQHFKYSALLPLFEAAADTETESGSVSSDLLYNFIGPGCSGWGWELGRDNRINYLWAVRWPGYNPPWAWAGMTLTTRIQGGIFLKISRFKTVVISMSWFCQRKQCKKVLKKD